MSSNNGQQSSGLSTCAPGFNPRSSVNAIGAGSAPIPVVPGSGTTVALAEGNFMRDNVFVTLSGDWISRPHGRRPPQGRMGATPYPTVQEVGEQSELGFK